MQELALMQSIVAAIENAVRPARVVCVHFQIGEPGGVAPQALRSCFAVCTQGTAMEGATLEIQDIAEITR
jgi:hydrogenase nickel incorporation protein HypA/HybF